MRSKQTDVNILVLNCGSSSLKYRIIRMPGEQEIIAGEAERVGIKTKESSTVTHTTLGKRRVISKDLPDHTSAFVTMLDLIQEDAAQNPEISFDLVGHRYVHPGNSYDKTTLVKPPVMTALHKTLGLAPIHNPISFGLVKRCGELLKNIDQYVVFDTSFHATIPPEYASYALPRALVKKDGLRKVGFHGISHQYVSEEACRFLGKKTAQQRIVSCHLGTGGSSVCAIQNGRSINTSMGFTPLEGLMMNTRCGDLDMGVFLYLMARQKLSANEMESMLNKKSGVLGVYESSSDLRDVIKQVAHDPHAAMVFDMYVRKVRAYVSFYAIILKKADTIIFTDSLGTGVPSLRSAICKDLVILGIRLDENKNRAYAGNTCDIASADSESRIIVIPTNEELMIAREVYKECV